MASTSTSAPKRRPKASKKGKKSWRKNTDVAEVEEFLEDQRLEERLGGAFKERKDEDLFQEDVVPQQEEQQEASLEAAPASSSRLAKRKARSERKLRCFSTLEITTGCPDPVKKRNRNKTREERKNPTVVKKEQERLRSGVKKAKEVLGAKHRTAALKQKASTQLERATRRRTKFDFDLWDDAGASALALAQGDKTGSLKSAKTDAALLNSEWIEEKTKQHVLKNEGKLKRKAPKDLRARTSALVAVEAPHAGASYNPSFKDHQDLLWKAAMVEVGKEKEQRRIEHHTTKMFPTADKAPTEDDYIREMSQGIGILEDEEDEEESSEEEEKEEEKAKEEEEDSDAEPTDREPDFKLKTRKQRRKAKLASAEQKRRDRAKAERQQHADILRAKSLNKGIAQQDARIAANTRKRRLQKDERLMTQPLTLSKHKFTEAEMELKLSGELTGNLRSLKPEGNLLADRYKSLQKRNVVETRVKHKIVKNPKKRKKLLKRSYRLAMEEKKK